MSEMMYRAVGRTSRGGRSCGLGVVALLLLMALGAAGCASDEVAGTAVTPTAVATADSAPTTMPTRTAVDTTPVPTTTSTAAGPSIQVTELLDGNGARDAIVAGVIVWDDRGARLCEALMESFPPQCGGQWVVVANPDRLPAELESTNGVRWTASPIDVAGRFDGDRFIIDVSDPSIEPTSTDRAFIDAFVRFARSGDGAAMENVPFASSVGIGLASEITQTVSAADLVDPTTWQIDRDEFRGWSGPFSALDMAREPLQITIGDHNRCAAPPEPAPVGLETARRVSIQPTNATSCLEWWTVDFFLTEELGELTINAVTLDLFAP